MHALDSYTTAIRLRFWCKQETNEREQVCIDAVEMNCKLSCRRAGQGWILTKKDYHWAGWLASLLDLKSPKKLFKN